MDNVRQVRDLPRIRVAEPGVNEESDFRLLRQSPPYAIPHCEKKAAMTGPSPLAELTNPIATGSASVPCSSSQYLSATRSLLLPIGCHVLSDFLRSVWPPE